ncbi:MAG: YebC/PmpR family DNA-binding transcriptional regulator [Candidatus Mycalebacterium zealandia]|nr:MAG: YebC/PmpR family DNA-binding transcriptional regulator [Candidatus Mycalebacterium zealandia]
MAGHSKWANIKHRKAAVDAKRGKVFTKVIRELTVATRQGGPDTDSNPRLRTAIAFAKSNNMPGDTIERAIKRGTGGVEGADFQEVFYEGYGPGGSAVYVQVLTDNRNRTVSDIRHIFSKYGGNLGENGCVAWMFEMKGRIDFSKKTETEKLFDAAIEAGAEDVLSEDGEAAVITAVEKFEEVKNVLEQAGFRHEAANVTMIPQSNVKIEGREANKMIQLVENLEDSDDVQNVYANFDIDEEILEELSRQT